MNARCETLYQILKKSLKPIPYEVFLKGKEFTGGLLIATLGVDIEERCHFASGDLSYALSGLLCEGIVLKKVIGRRSVLVFGEWRFSQGAQRYKEIFYYKLEELLPHEVGSLRDKLLSRYSESERKLIEDVFVRFAQTRRTKRISTGVTLNILQSWDRFSTAAVVQGCTIYLEQNLFEDGYSEDYCTGIIRNVASEDSTPIETPVVQVGVDALRKKREESNKNRND